MRIMGALPPAPGELEHPALGLVNTVHTTTAGTTDLIEDPHQASRWLIERELLALDTRLGASCATRLRALREEIRSLLTSATQTSPPTYDAIAALNTALTAAPTTQLLTWAPDHGWRTVTPHPLDRAPDHLLALLARDAVDLLTGSDADKITMCGAAPCSRFLLRTHGARQWCSVRCGDRVRAARAYARRTTPNPPP